MLPFLSITGISIFIILLYFNVRKYPSSIYLGIYFLLVSIYVFQNFAAFYSKSVFLVSITFIHFGFLSFLTGPMLYWYIRGVLTDHHRLVRRDLWHLLPMLAFLIASLPYYVLPMNEKTRIAHEIVNNADFLGTFHIAGFYKVVSPEVVYLSRPFLIMVYTIWSTFLFAGFVKRNKTSPVLTRQYFMTGWITVLLGFTFLLNVSHFLMIIRTFEEKDSGMLFSLNLLQILSATGLSGLMISPFFFPRILYGLPRLPEKTGFSVPIPESPDPPKEEIKKTTLNLEADYLISIGSKADSCMEELQPYLKHEFNLTHLSVLIDIPVHHLAYFFREIKKLSFNDYRNEWRINHAKNLIRKGMAHEVTLEAIGQMSGFSNRNTFRIMFEKVEGISPSSYASHKNDEIKAHLPV